MAVLVGKKAPLLSEFFEQQKEAQDFVRGAMLDGKLQVLGRDGKAVPTDSKTGLPIFEAQDEVHFVGEAASQAAKHMERAAIETGLPMMSCHDDEDRESGRRAVFLAVPEEFTEEVNLLTMTQSQAARIADLIKQLTLRADLKDGAAEPKMRVIGHGFGLSSDGMNDFMDRQRSSFRANLLPPRVNVKPTSGIGLKDRSPQEMAL